MCLAIPGKIVEIYEQDGLRMGKLDFGGMVRKACLQYVPTATIGEYALIHVGFALATVSPEEANRTFELLESIGEVEAAFNAADQDTPPEIRGAP